MTNHYRIRINKFVSLLLRQTHLTDEVCTSLSSLAGSASNVSVHLYDEEVNDPKEAEELRREFVQQHVFRRQLLVKLFSLRSNKSVPGLEHKWHSIIVDVVSVQSSRDPLHIGLEILFSLKHIICAGNATATGRTVAIDCFRHILFRGHFVEHLTRSNSLPAEDISDVCTLLAGLPSVIANVTCGSPPEDFETIDYLQSLLRDVIIAVKAPHANLNFAGRLFGRLCHTGHNVIIWRFLLPLCSSENGQEVSQILHKILKYIDTAHVSAVLLPLFRLSPNWRLICDLIINDEEQQRRSDIESVVRQTLMGHHHLPGLGASTDDDKCGNKTIRNAVSFAAAYSVDFLHDIFIALLHAWSASHAVEGPIASHRHHLFCSQALLATLRHLNALDRIEEVRGIVLPAISLHLASTVAETRLIGMVVGELLVQRLQLGSGEEGTQLAFEYTDTAESKLLKTMMEEDDDTDEKMSTDLPFVLEKQSEPTANISTLDSDDDEEEEHLEDFTPMDMSHDVPVSRGSAPKYVRDCLNGLRSSGPEDTENLMACINAAERLILSHQSAAREVAVDFAHAVIHLAPDCPVEGLARKRVAILVALVEVAPIPVAEFLTSSFYAPNYSITHRLDMLAAIADSAQRLSSPQASTCASHLSTGPKNSVTSDPDDWRREIEARVAAKTRRFASATRQPAASPSRFAPVAGHFFFPLLGAFDRPIGVLDLLQRDYLVLGRLLLTLSCIVSCAENAPALPNMARAMLDFVAVLRGHPDPSVRRGLLFACAAVAGACPAHILLPDLADELTETRRWLERCRFDDPDSDCRQLAVWTASVVGARFRDFISITS